MQPSAGASTAIATRRHKLVTSHLPARDQDRRTTRPTACRSPRRISEGMSADAGSRALRAEKGFRFATYAVWWIKAANPGIHPALVVAGEVGTTATRRRCSSPPQAQSKISILDDGDMRLDQVKIIAWRIRRHETDVIA